MKTYKYLITEDFQQVGSRLGSNVGGKYTSNGEHYYIKFPKNPDQAKTEVLTGKIQKLMGINTLEPEHKIIGGKHAVVTKWVNDMDKLTHHNSYDLSHDQNREIGKIFAAGVLTKNWDAVGTGLNYGSGNIDIHRSGKIYNIDPGGSFEFRAQGAHKDYTPDVNEIHTLRNPSMNLESASIFNTAFTNTPDAIQHGVNAVKNLDDDKVKEVFANSGLSNWEELHQTFKSRKEQFLNHFK